MSSKFSIQVPFETRPPRLKDLVNKYVMGDVWIRDTPFGPVTDFYFLRSQNLTFSIGVIFDDEILVIEILTIIGIGLRNCRDLFFFHRFFHFRH